MPAPFAACGYAGQRVLAAAKRLFHFRGLRDNIERHTMKLAFYFLAASLLAAAADDDAKLLPDGPGKDVVVRACLECHDASSFRKQRLNRDDWGDKVSQMVDQGAQATGQEQTVIVDYLVHNFGPDSKVRIN